MKILVPQRDLPRTKKKFLPLHLFGALVLNFMFFFVVLIDIATWLYQEIYFSINSIPKIKRGDFVTIDRHKLKKLNLIQKWSCWYCEYTNGVIAWIKAVANQTEIYSCAIKYSHHFPGQEYQKEFYEQKEFEKEQV